MGALKDKLERLYRLAILRPEEENDDARKNEARTSAFLLIKIARENGVAIKFQIPAQKAAPPPVSEPAPRYAQASRPTGFGGFDPFNEYFRNVRGYSGRGKSPADVFEELFRETMKSEQARKEREAEENRVAEEVAGEPDFFDPRNNPINQPFKRPTRQTAKTRRETKPGHTPPLIVANYGGTCRICKKPYSVGSKIWWVQGWGSSHEECGYEELVRQAVGG